MISIFRVLKAAFLLPLLATASSAEEPRIEKNVAYLGEERAEKLDVYFPPEKFIRPLPAVVWIHGGGWVAGGKSGSREVSICRTLAENGYVCFSIDYKLGRQTAAQDGKPVEVLEVPWPRNIHDCKTAIRFVRENAAVYGVDPARIAVAGGSAGGHLALVAGLSADDAELNKGGLYQGKSSAVSCIIDFYGPTLIEGHRVEKFRGATAEETAVNARAGSPVLQVGPMSPPVLVLHGTADKTCDVSFSRNLVARMKEVGTVHQYIEVPGAPHSFDLQPQQMDLRPAVLDFLGKHLGAPR